MDESLSPEHESPAERLLAIGYFSLGLILFSIGLYGFILLFQIASAQIEHFSL